MWVTASYGMGFWPEQKGKGESQLSNSTHLSLLLEYGCNMTSHVTSPVMMNLIPSKPELKQALLPQGRYLIRLVRYLITITTVRKVANTSCISLFTKGVGILEFRNLSFVFLSIVSFSHMCKHL